MFRPVANGLDGFSGFGVGLSYNIAANQFHVGMLYRSNAEAWFCHLAWHFLLRNEIAGDVDGLYWANSELDPFNREVMRDVARTLATNVEGLPYGFNVRGEAFDSQTGAALPLPPGEGLTCATFVLAAHRHRGLELLIEAEWPIREDDTAWQQHIVTLLEDYCARHGFDAQKHVAALQADVGKTARYRPDEVAAGATSPDIPLGFQSARALADEIVEQLTSPVAG